MLVDCICRAHSSYKNTLWALSSAMTNCTDVISLNYLFLETFIELSYYVSYALAYYGYCSSIIILLIQVELSGDLAACFTLSWRYHKRNRSCVQHGKIRFMPINIINSSIKYSAASTYLFECWQNFFRAIAANCEHWPDCTGPQNVPELCLPRKANYWRYRSQYKSVIQWWSSATVNWMWSIAII